MGTEDRDIEQVQVQESLHLSLVRAAKTFKTFFYIFNVHTLLWRFLTARASIPMVAPPGAQKIAREVDDPGETSTSKADSRISCMI